jgi:hypothetical protein
MLNLISRTGHLLCHRARLLFVLACVFFINNPHQAFSSVYSSPPYTNTVFNCTTGVGCCSPAGVTAIVNDAITGTLVFTTSSLQYYYTNTLWPMIEDALKGLADEFRRVILYSMAAKGAMLDAQTLNKTLVSLTTQTAKTLVTQTPSEQICRFGTVSRSLAQSDDKARVVQLGLAKQMMQRELMTKDMAAAYEAETGSKLGRTSDKLSRFELYKKTFCDPKDSNATLGDSWCTASTDDQRNQDIEITRALYSPLTLQLDFSPSGVGTKTKDEENIFALANNLFAHNLPVNMEKADFEAMTKDSTERSQKKIEQLMAYRSLTAKRNVAQNSFAALASMKAEGSNGSTTYLKAIIAELGLDGNGQDSLMGQNPSYNAQMELLTRKLYQSPSFYANLMESNPNVARQQTAMEAIGLMQDRDIYESLRRSEMVLSTLLEMYVTQEQDRLKDKGTKN